MLTSNRMVQLSADMRAYLKDEADRRGVDVATVYEEEMTSRRQFSQDPFTLDELRLLAATSRPNPRLLESDEKCPF